MNRRILASHFWVGFVALTQKLMGQIQFTQLDIKQVRMNFNPAHFEVSEVNGATYINLRPIILEHKALSGSGANWAISRQPLIVYRNGLAMLNGLDYTYNNNLITFIPGQVPVSGDVITALF